MEKFGNHIKQEVGKVGNQNSSKTKKLEIKKNRKAEKSRKSKSVGNWKKQVIT